MSLSQPCILAELSSHSRYLTFSINTIEHVRPCLQSLKNTFDANNMVIGFGQSLASALNTQIPKLHDMPAQSNLGVEIPSIPAALWCWIRGNDRGEIFHLSRDIISVLSPGFSMVSNIDTFVHKDSRDLTGYEDGTENPTADDAIETAIAKDMGAGLDGSSYVAVQQWVHDFSLFQNMAIQERDFTIGRRISDNQELQEAPESAHVKRTAQESFDPTAFILRRSMPWTDKSNAGLYFIAFGKSFDAFEALLNRMLGFEDGIVDALFRFTRPVNGAYFWCPPISKGKLNLSIFGI